jgi:hypothetical protein
MAQSQNTIREIFIANGALATETTLKAFTASASTGEIGVLSKGGEAPAYGVPFVVAYKTADSVIVSDVVDPLKVEKLKLVEYAAEVPKVITASAFPVPATAGDKYEYIVDIRLFNHGSLSVENFYIKHGQHILTQTSAPLTAQAAVDALVVNLNKNFSKEPGATATTNPLFTFSRGSSGANSTLIITAKAQPLELGKKEGRALEFDVVVRVSKVGDEDFGITQPTVAVTTPAHPGTGTGKQVAKLEYFYRGARGDAFRGLNYPYNWPTTTKTLTDQALTYNLIELKHFITGDGLNALKMPKELTIAIAETAGTTTEAEALIAAIEAYVVKPDLVAEPE